MLLQSVVCMDLWMLLFIMPTTSEGMFRWRRRHTTVESPLILEEDSFEKIIVINGTKSTIKCQLPTIFNITDIKWLRKQRQILTNGSVIIPKDDRFSLLTTGYPQITTHALVIHPITELDEGEYQCRHDVNNTFVSLNRVLLNVQVPPKMIQLPRFSNRLVEGDPLVLTCYVNGKPRPKVEFFYENPKQHGRRIPIVELFKNLKMNESSDYIIEGNGYLEIKRINRAMKGIFICIGSNGVGNSSIHQIPLNISYEPSVRMLNKYLRQEPGKRAILACEVTSNPKIQPKWEVFDRETKIWINLSNIECSKFDQFPLERRCIEESCEKRSDDVCQSKLYLSHLKTSDFTDYKCSVDLRTGGQKSDIASLIQHVPMDSNFASFRKFSLRSKSIDPNNTTDIHDNSLESRELISEFVSVVNTNGKRSEKFYSTTVVCVLIFIRF